MNSHAAISAASVSVGHGPGAGGNEGTTPDRGTAAPDSNFTAVDTPQEPRQPEAAREKDSANFSGAQPHEKSTVPAGTSGYVPSASATGEEDPGANSDPTVPPQTDPSPLPEPPPAPQPPPREIDPPPPMEDPQPGHEVPTMPQPIATRS